MNHTAISMAHRRVPSHLPASLVWPFDCEVRCGKQVRVPTGLAVAYELTRNLREPFRSQVESHFPAAAGA